MSEKTKAPVGAGADSGSASGAVVYPHSTTIALKGQGGDVVAQAQSIINDVIGEPVRLPPVFLDRPYLADTEAGAIIFAFEAGYIPEGARAANDPEAWDRLHGLDLPHLNPRRLDQEAARCEWLLTWSENPVALAWLRRRKAAIRHEQSRRKEARRG